MLGVLPPEGDGGLLLDATRNNLRLLTPRLPTAKSCIYNKY